MDDGDFAVTKGSTAAKLRGNVIEEVSANPRSSLPALSYRLSRFRSRESSQTAMEADLAQPPPPPPATSSAAGLKRVPSRPSSRNAASERGQLDPKLTKWEEWDRYATSMDCDWVVERDMQVFHNALSDEPSNNNLGNDGADQQQPEKIIAASDWAPVKEQRRRRGGGGGSSSKPKKRKDVVREGWAYHISRWPLLGLIFLIIFLEFVAYLIVRQSVNTIEFFAGCPSPCSFSLRCGNLPD